LALGIEGEIRTRIVRYRNKLETRDDLARAALELASAQGLARVRVPDIAASAGVSTRTFNNYFSSREAAIVWPAQQRATQLADDLLARPSEEPLGDALMEAVTARYRRSPEGPAARWMTKFRRLVATEPSLRGEYLKVSDASEHALARAIAERIGASQEALRPKVLAAIVVAAERAGVRHSIQNPHTTGQPLADTVRAAVAEALKEVQR
jgi:AcrR family transcriptional regulator